MNMTTLNKTSRRNFLKLTSITGGGLILGDSWLSAEEKIPVLATEAGMTGNVGLNSYL